MLRKRNNKSIFKQTHHYRSRQSAKEAKSAMLANTATLNYDLAQCFKRYLQRLSRISRVSYHAQAEPIRKQMFNLYKNAEAFANADEANK